MPTRKTSLTLDTALLDEARSYGIDVSAAAQSGVAGVVKAERARRLREELQPEIAAHDDYVERNGLPLARVRDVWPEG